MPDIIDVSQTCDSQAGFLAGVKTIFRYYSRDTSLPSKRVSREEAQAFAAAGLRLGIVHEARFGNRVASFSKDLGALDGAYARDYGTKTIDQPAGSAIYFAVDFDATPEQIRDAIVPYFQGVGRALGPAGSGRNYNVGVYGSGEVCTAVLDAGLATLAWLSQSTGWAGFKPFLDSKRWSMRQEMPATVGEVDCDANEGNPDRPEIGDFLILPEPNAPSIPLTVIARDGLRMRSGPGTAFDVLRVLPNGTKVHPIKVVGDWTMVDLAGDQAADGFVNTHFLA